MFETFNVTHAQIDWSYTCCLDEWLDSTVCPAMNFIDIRITGAIGAWSLLAKMVTVSYV